MTSDAIQLQTKSKRSSWEKMTHVGKPLPDRNEFTTCCITLDCSLLTLGTYNAIAIETHGKALKNATLQSSSNNVFLENITYILHVFQIFYQMLHYLNKHRDLIVLIKNL